MGGSASVQLVMLGLDTSGKTTVLYRLKFDQYMNAMPTIGFNCEKIKATTGKAKGITFTIWDIGGQDKTRPLWRSYTRSSDGIIYVLDSVDKERIEEAKIELMKLVRSPDNPGLPILILANKQDLRGSLTPHEIETMMSVHELPHKQLCYVHPVCAITGDGLDDAMDIMYELIEKRKKLKKKR